MHRLSRRAVVVGSAAALAGCLGGSDSSRDGGDGSDVEDDATTATTTARATTRETESESAAESGSSGDGPPLADATLPVQYDYETLRDAVRSGGPPKDGIPSVDDPQFWSASEADEELDAGDVVFGVVRNGDVKAYPQHVLVWHEVCNDTLGDEPVAISYCPLTGTAMGFERGDTTFGVSGDLVNNNLVMYDRATDSRWPQVLGTAISGEHEGASLHEFRLVWTTWQRWKAAHPDTLVLSEETGYVRNYDHDPYGSYNPKGGYYTNDDTLFSRLAEDGRFSLKTVVVGSRTPDGVVAFPKFALRRDGVVTGTVDGTPYLAVLDESLATGYVYRNPDGLEFTYEDERPVGPDGTAHEAADLPLDRVYSFDAMWFAWAGFYPETAVGGDEA